MLRLRKASGDTVLTLRAVRVSASAGRSERVYTAGVGFDAALTKETVELALAQAKIAPGALDIMEFHDAFAVEELEYVEAMGVRAEGQ